MLAAHPTHHSYSFGKYVLDVDRGALLKNGAEVRLRRQSFDVLRYLVEHHHRLVTKNELMAAIWPGTIVTDGSLTQCLLDVRRAIGDEERLMVRTIPRRGYKFEPAVREHDASAAAAPPAARNWRRLALAAGLLLALAASGTWFATGARVPGTATVANRPDVDPHSIAVLPFTDMSERQNQQYLSDGVSEE